MIDMKSDAPGISAKELYMKQRGELQERYNNAATKKERNKIMKELAALDKSRKDFFLHHVFGRGQGSRETATPFEIERK